MKTAILEGLLGVIRVLPESTLLLASGGEIVGANLPAREALGLGHGPLEGGRLADQLGSAPEQLASFLRLCSRNTELIPGSFAVRQAAASPREYLCAGCLVARSSAETPAFLMIRFWPKEAEGNPFILLNQKLAELTDEIQRRKVAEEQLRQSEAKLLERAVEAEGINRAKDEFLATLSHELRTPLNAILGWVTMLRGGRLADGRRERALETIERNARAQALLIEELLDISAIVTGKLNLTLLAIDPRPSIEAAIESIRPAAESKGLFLLASLEPQAGQILADAGRLQQICWNLLSNAVKFTPHGGTIEVLLERKDGHAELTVSDSGKGIDPAFLPHVFERFRQQDGSVTRRFGGLGLGLAIVKSIVEMHGGAILVRSAGENQGATFVARFPVLASQRGPEAEAAGSRAAPRVGSEACPPEIEGLRILVVEDESDALEFLVLLLEQCGATVTAARSAAEGFAALERILPDILISDIGMPDEDGYSFLRRVRRLPPAGGGRTHAIALTAFARAEDRMQALKAGFHAHVPKPIEPAELLAVIASLVGRSSFV